MKPENHPFESSKPSFLSSMLAYSKQPQDPLGLLDRRQRDAENFDGEVFAFLELSCCRFFVG